MLLLKIILMYSIFWKISWCKLEPLPDDASSRVSLSNCLINAAGRFFSYSGLLTMSVPAQEVPANKSSVTVLDRILLPQLFLISDWTILVKNISMPSFVTRPVGISDFYIIQIRAPIELEITMKTFITLGSWNPHAKFIVTTGQDFPDRVNAVTQIVQVLWSYKVLNAVVLLPKIENDIESEVYTWYPYTDGRCGLEYTKVRLIDSCTYGIFTNETEWFPNKIPDNLNGCELKIEFVTWPPYVMAPEENIAPNKTYRMKEGVEVQLMNAIAKTAGLNLSYTTSVIPQNWGFIYVNGTATGMMKNLLEENIELAIGSISANNERHKFFDHTIPYFQDAFTWCVPAAQQIQSWKNFVLIFGVSTWVGIFGSYIFIMLIMWACAKNQPDESTVYSDLPNCFQNMMAMFVGLSIKILPKTSHIKFIALMWLLFSMIITTAYKTLLISVLTEPSYEEQMSTLEEILASKLRVQCLKDMSQYFDVSDTDVRVQKLLKKWTNCDDMKTCLDRTAFARDSAVAIPRIHLNYVLNNYRMNSGGSKLHCDKESIVSFPIELLMVRGHPLNARINNLLVRAVGAGLVEKWMADIKNFKGNEENGDKTTNIVADVASTEQTLTMKHLLGVFGGYGLCLLFSIVVFILEVLVWKVETHQINIHYPFSH